MFLHQLTENYHYEDELDARTIQAMVNDIEEKLEEINDKSVWISETKPNPQREAQLERQYIAYEAIKMILRNDLRRKDNKSLRPGTIILYSFEGDEELPSAAVQARVTGEDVEIKWVGSVVPGEGKKLIEYALKIAKEQGAKRAELLAKYGSEPYYRKHGYTQTTQQGTDPISGTGERFERYL